MVDGGKTENWWWTMRPSTPSLWSIRAGRPDDAALDDEETGPSVDSLQGETGQSAVDSQAAADVMRMMLMTTVVAVAAVEEEEEAVEEEEAGMSFRIALFPRLCASPKTHQHTHTHTQKLGSPRSLCSGPCKYERTDLSSLFLCLPSKEPKCC